MSSHLQIIADLEMVNEIQHKILKAMSTRLAELGDTETCKDELAEADKIYRRIMGGCDDENELPF